MTMLSEAIKYAEKGWYVFPCREKDGNPQNKNGEIFIPRAKSPYISKWDETASVDAEQIEAWWGTWPNALIGINCEKSNLFVVDLDVKGIGKNGIDTFSSFGIEHKNIALHSQTPTGGWHLVFSGSGKTTTNAGAGIDTRGRGGYFIAPPSEIISGDGAGKYIAKDDWSRVPGNIPEGLFDKLFPDDARRKNDYMGVHNLENKQQVSRRTSNFVINGAETGNRNNELFKAIADFYGCGYTKEEIREILIPVCDKMNYPRGEFETTLDSAISKPRSPSIPIEIQEKINNKDKNIASKISDDYYHMIEEGLISALIENNTAISTVADLIGYKDFLSEKMSSMFKVILTLHEKSYHIDKITMLDYSNGGYKEEDINNLLNYYEVNVDNLITYCNIIKEKSALRKLKKLFERSQETVNSGKPLLELINNIEKELVNISIDGGVKTSSVMSGDSAMEMVAQTTRAISNGEIVTLNTGFIDFDEHAGGLMPTDLMIIAARPGEGKSALSLSIANHVGIKQNKGVLMFTLEASTHETVCRLITQLTGLSYMKVFKGKLTEMEWKTKYKVASEQIRSGKIFFDDSSGITIPEIRAKIRQKLSEQELSLVIIDQLEQIRAYETLPPNIQFDRIGYDIKAIAKEFGVPIILNHQLNRSVTDRKLKDAEPQLSDLNQAGEKPVNHVWAIVHKKDEDGNIIRSKIKALKNRNGPLVSFPVQYVKERMLFQNSTAEDVRIDYSDNSDDSFDEYSVPSDWS